MISKHFEVYRSGWAGAAVDVAWSWSGLLVPVDKGGTATLAHESVNKTLVEVLGTVIVIDSYRAPTAGRSCP